MDLIRGIKILTAVLVLLLGSCGDEDDGPGDKSLGPDITGMYEIIRSTENDAHCLFEGPPFQSQSSHFRISWTQSPSPSTTLPTILRFDFCGSSDPQSCRRSYYWTYLFIPINGGWKGREGIAGWNYPGCDLEFNQYIATQVDSGVRLQLKRTGEAAPELSYNECTPQTAIARGMSMPCDGHIVHYGRLIGP